MPKYYAKNPINRDGSLYPDGSLLNLTEAEAKPMLELGTLVTEDQFNEIKVHKEAIDAQAHAIEQANTRIAQLEAQLAAKDAPAKTETTNAK